MKTIIITSTVILVSLAVLFSFPSSYKIKNADPIGETIVCFGDSLTYGTGATKGMDYPSQLSRLIDIEVINSGVPGDTTEKALNRIDKIINMNPRIVLITIGGNDLKNGVKKEIAFKNIEQLIHIIQKNGALVILGGIDVPFWGRGFGRGYIELAEKTGSVLVQNIFKDIFGKPRLMSDSIHPNNQGYTIMAKHFYKALKPYL
ncbi:MULTISPECIES: GDSL-type esterase/lipase family protein [Desulfobacula]|uniref:Predicted lipase, GDSL-type n=2 Tax=Desulfobacula TaxID=28222 RepID=K0NF06_DESTT|nr:MULTISPECIES: GDSL-type esterase/lipase family protein [Desulfobacula]CCK78208.1 predicted lipase, GDSL-type [Desulfobacula toluolica Tol2]SDU56579.1 Lysophospholipase L1 [Desulfobacula phenolica]